MSKFGYCVNGGQDGIQVTTKEMEVFAEKAEVKFIDAFIPLPDVPADVQLKRIKECTCEHEQQYWERENGKHGWCCSNCGSVNQWG